MHRILTGSEQVINRLLDYIKEGHILIILYRLFSTFNASKRIVYILNSIYSKNTIYQKYVRLDEQCIVSSGKHIVQPD